MSLSDFEMNMVYDARKALMQIRGYSRNWCGYCTWLLKVLLGRGNIINGKLNSNYHWWLEIDDNFVIDITADQFGFLPIITEKRPSYYDVDFIEDFKKFTDVWITNYFSGFQGRSELYRFYKEVNDNYPRQEIGKLLSVSPISQIVNQSLTLKVPGRLCKG